MNAENPYVETVAIVVLFVLAIVAVFFAGRLAALTRADVSPASRDGKFIHSRAYIPFVRLAGLFLLFICWLLIRRRFHLEP